MKRRELEVHFTHSLLKCQANDMPTCPFCASFRKADEAQARGNQARAQATR